MAAQRKAEEAEGVRIRESAALEAPLWGLPGGGMEPWSPLQKLRQEPNPSDARDTAFPLGMDRCIWALNAALVVVACQPIYAAWRSGNGARIGFLGLTTRMQAWIFVSYASLSC